MVARVPPLRIVNLFHSKYLGIVTVGRHWLLGSDGVFNLLGIKMALKYLPHSKVTIPQVPSKATLDMLS